jgi:6-pyruvoyltetrahydropterin/6-carboxytetrahydropterin synthase
VSSLIVRRRYELEVAHHLTSGVPPHHKCRRMHGHRYVLTLSLAGIPDHAGILIEYEELDWIVRPVLRLVDHHTLNDLDRRCSTRSARAVAANPTAERLLMWFCTRLGQAIASVGRSKELRLARLVLEEDAAAAVEWWDGGADCDGSRS